MWKKILICLTLLLSCIVVKAKTYNASNLPVDMTQITFSRVVNPDGILSSETVSAIDTLLLHLQRNQGVEAMIIAITNIENDDPFEFTRAVFQKYGVGNKDNTGFIITLATDDRSYQIMTGIGLEGTLPDAVCKRIENRVMVPCLKQGDWNQAMLRTVTTIKEYVEGDETLRQAYATDDGEDPYDWLWALGMFLGPMAIVAYMVHRSNKLQKTCKQCGKPEMKCVSRTQQKISKHTTRISEVWVCQACGHSETRTRDHTETPNPGGGAIIGGMGGGGFGGGQSTGSFGGFGGGRTMGGGAGGRF
ncbi:MAG: TPM domain-containing protein [Bacteroidales bacterium]|nr:TPM domain-containing protein [Bacteroidales bacterium]